MTNEQTIDEIMDAVLASQDYAFRRGDGLDGYEESVAADQCVRDMVTAALAAKDAEIAECDDLRADMASILRAVAIAVRGPEIDGISWGWADLPGRVAAAMNMMSGAVELAREHAAEIAELKQRLADSMRDLQAPTPAPGEWIEWNGGECPIADGVGFQFKFRNDSQNKEKVHYKAPEWNWNYSSADDDIVAYRVLP